MAGKEFFGVQNLNMWNTAWSMQYILMLKCLKAFTCPKLAYNYVAHILQGVN